MAGSTQIDSFKKLLAGAGLPELGPGPRPGVLPLDKLDAVLNPLLRESGLGPASQTLVRGLMLLWHDHFDSAHATVQDIEDADGNLLHAILHRREPDYGNAAYWFRRVGRHAIFPELGWRVSRLLESSDEKAAQSRLLPAGEWDPFIFIKLCEKSARGNSEISTQLLRQVQGLETEILLEYWLK